MPTARTESRTETVAAPPLALDLHWTGNRLASVTLHFQQARTQTPGLSPVGRAVAEALRRYVAGQPPGWPGLDLDFDALPPFTARVLRALAEQVPEGRSVTYGELAALAGSPGAARAVGQAMARNPWPLIVPCHRVLGAHGALTGYTNPSGTDLKAWLLRHEGALEG